ncbi:hypothetical protein [Azospirillum sp. TSO22-1]|uniref:hypothetical protein n=1 Tax=Azospirillum sp. TSO22-1 TaxID=716789 RepID=UPI0011B5E46D|nr:hypothetical protein [Azospirillum sp. TSO22-1]
MPPARPACFPCMPDAPLTCTYLIKLGGRVVRVSVTSQLTRPVVVHFRVEPVEDAGACRPIVATWSQGAWNVFEGAEGTDPRPILGFAVEQGYPVCAPCPRDLRVVKSFLTQLAQTPALWQR